MATVIKPKRQSEVDKLEYYRACLSIDRVDLDGAVAKQPELFDHVSEAHVLALAERDAAKLELEEAQAEEDKKIRVDAAANDERITEAAIQQELKLNPRVKGLHRRFLELKAETEKWQVLKESYIQRSYMLRELVALFLSRVSSRGSVTAAQGDLADMNRARAGEERTRRRFGANKE